MLGCCAYQQNRRTAKNAGIGKVTHHHITWQPIIFSVYPLRFARNHASGFIDRLRTIHNKHEED
jgi:hypothetical protein